MREDVEETAASSLADRFEVAPPDLLDAAPGIPDAVVVHVDGPVLEEVHRADHVVEVVGLQQIGHSVLRAGHEVGLDPQPQVGLLAHERAIGVEIVTRVGHPERVLPDIERRFEAVDVL